jgi:hypothetical protein
MLKKLLVLVCFVFCFQAINADNNDLSGLVGEQAQVTKNEQTKAQKAMIRVAMACAEIVIILYGGKYIGNALFKTAMADHEKEKYFSVLMRLIGSGLLLKAGSTYIKSLNDNLAVKDSIPGMGDILSNAFLAGAGIGIAFSPTA